MEHKTYQIAIDGPAGAGKSTIARLIAGKLGFIYVDTGAMYRAIALHFLRQGIGPEAEETVAEGLEGITVTITYEDGQQQVWLNGENVSGLIRTEEVSNMASAASSNSLVREKLLQLQRDLAYSENVVMDGRDIGTVVLPEADIKIYLTASVKTRAKRRYLELTDRGIPCNIEEIADDITQRDYRDMNRAISPLKQADDAILVDSSDMTVDEVVEEILCICQKAKSNCDGCHR
ncbi:(d)CMP kinase [Lachnotalea sp. AF33-28]|uniref:(d)CMP kinase n=1 Tax=Lachnotalea sp. AF33-28 TaxID=2292046 RepID=UPI000E5024BE|nr:(d)CMP kinase [Lachnotalea sp. AF33-28]RHP34626.1 (d)CMP kinase [Lachnotalea sp. AF33-28]